MWEASANPEMLVDPIETDLGAPELFEDPDPNESPWWPQEDMPGAEGEPWRDVDQFPKGKYFIGDPCHVISDYFGLVPEGMAIDLDGIGRVFWVSIDGLTQGTDADGFYSCDSMAIGIVPVDHLEPGHWAALKKLGRLIEWKTGDYLPDDEDDDWEGPTCAGIDFLGNVYLGNDWWFSDEFLEGELLPDSLSFLKVEDC